ncbi:MAG: 2,3-bisphosphoglycerate-independent phosphoglycerate mutase [Thermodesulfobacteriota bacterium]
MLKTKRPLMLMILDGWGINPSREGNAIAAARTPNLDRLFSEYAHTQLLCSGEAVGLPEGYMGNSEVGHLNLGAGRVVYQDLMRINLSIRDGSFFNNRVFGSLMDSIKARNTSLHLMGLLSDGGVHSHVDHLQALVKMAAARKIPVLIHAILDGRDTPPDSGKTYLANLQEFLASFPQARIATICGRFYAMDRDTRWDRTEKAFRLYTTGEGIVESDPVTAIANAYNRGETDEFVVPVTIPGASSSPAGVLAEKDGLIFFNFRSDRARQIVRAFTEKEFSGFSRAVIPRLCDLVCMTQYDKTMALPVAFPPVYLTHTLGETMAHLNYAQLRIAETEKYAHVTYFFNGGVETPFAGEERVLIPSPRDVATYDLKPEMSAAAVAGALVEQIRQDKHDLIVVNFANLDMVGHTGVFEAAVTACEEVDRCVGMVMSEFSAKNGIALITADHGNAEQMMDENGAPHTAHTVNPVPLILVDDSRKKAVLRKGRLGDIAPTILSLMDLAKPAEMTGASLIE